MSISRLLRVLATVIIVISLVFVVVSEYQHNRKVNSMVELSDAASSVATRISTDQATWVGEGSREHDYVLDPQLLENGNYIWNLGGENYASRVEVKYGDNLGNTFGPYGREGPGDKMANALSIPVVVRTKGRYLPAKLKVIIWRI